MANLIGHYEDANGNLLFPILSGATLSIETRSKSSQSYTKGSYFYFKDKLCKATTSILYNDALELGVNIMEVSLGDELSSHLIASNGEEFSFQAFLDGEYG